MEKQMTRTKAGWGVVKRNTYLLGMFLTALLLIFFGVAWLGFNVGWFPIEYKPLVISSGMFIILVGIGHYIKGNWIKGTFLLFLGLFLFMPRLQDAFPDADIPDISFRTYWPALLIIAGGWFIVRMARVKSRLDNRKIYASREIAGYKYDRNRGDEVSGVSDRIDKNVAFSSSRQIIFSSDFFGGEVNVVFCEMILDMSKVESLNSENMLEVNTAFGTAVIYVPHGWTINYVKNETFAGAIEDTRNRDQVIPADAPRLNLKCSAAFGNIAIRN